MVTHYHPCEPRDDEPDCFLMRGMREIGVTGGGVFKEHHEAVSEALTQSFGARVHAVGEIEDAGNFPRQILHDAPDLGDVMVGELGFEFEEADVFDAFHSLASGSR